MIDLPHLNQQASHHLSRRLPEHINRIPFLNREYLLFHFLLQPNSRDRPAQALINLL